MCFNRGKQHYTTSYTFLNNSSDNLLSIGLQRNDLQSHQLNFSHKIRDVWLLNVKGATHKNKNFSENFPNRNYRLASYEANPKLSFLHSLQTRIDLFYNLKTKENKLGNQEHLRQHTLGFSFAYSNAEKISVNGEFNYISNIFKGASYSPVAYQMLEGLRPGTNFTWQLLFQKRITQYLDANLLYFGRKSEMSKTVHTGSVQLRAYF
jgi:outer membrane receptor protein involved in Fe transport